MPRPNPKALAKSPLIREVPEACADEAAAVEFMEARRWGGKPVCAHCSSDQVYQMQDAGGGRSKRFLWRCRSCSKQYTVRVGTIFEDSRMPLRHWCYAFWRCCSSKKGLAALQLSRELQITYKSALFMLNRIRFAMAPDHATAPKLDQIVEADETFIGGKVHRHSRPRTKLDLRGQHRKTKAIVFAVVQRGGDIRVRPIADVSGATLRRALVECVKPSAHLMTDEYPAYKGIGKSFLKHSAINHSEGVYKDGLKSTNTVEGFFSILKRGLTGVYHCVSRTHLPRYLAEFEFRYNARFMNDGERMALAISWAEGKRLMYRYPKAQPPKTHPESYPSYPKGLQ